MWLYGHENSKESHFDNIQKSGFYGWVKLYPYAAILIARMRKEETTFQGWNKGRMKEDERG